MIRHIVLFSAKSGCVERVIDNLGALQDIPASDIFQVGKNLKIDPSSQEIDVVVYAEFSSRDKLAAFKSHPIYQATIAKVKPDRELRLVADYEC